MWLIYAMGGGWGHLTRAAALARAASPPVRILTNSPYATRISCSADVIAIDPGLPFDEACRRVVREITEARASVLIVDTFARGLGGELGGCGDGERRVLVARDIVPRYAAQVKGFVRASYDLVIAPGEGTADLAIRTAPWLTRDHLPRTTREGILVLAGGNVDELTWYGEVTRRLSRVGVPVSCVAAKLPPACPPRCWMSYWPAMDLIARSRLVIGGGGYNTVHECAALNVPLVARPWPRKYDRQWLRARRAAAVVKTPEQAVAAALDLLDREPPPPRFKFTNGAAEAASLLLFHFAR